MTGSLAGNLADDGHVATCKEESIDDPANWHADDQADEGPYDADDGPDNADDGPHDADDGHDDDQDVDMWLRAKKRAPACSSNCAKGHQRWELSSALMKVMRMRRISAVII